MSGLAGAIHLRGAPLDPDTLGRMAAAGALRAGDGAQLWRSAQAGLIRFGRAATPEAVRENQPLRDPATGVVICFDGRLDNRCDLLEMLGSSGGPDRDAADCALVLALYGQTGEQCPRHMVGDYAFAVWQPGPRRLFCARSPLGWRPFQWYCDGNVFAFAGDAKTIVDGLGLPRRLNEAALGEYLGMHYASPTETLWRDIRRLEPGGALLVDDGRLRQWHWHDGPFPDLSERPEEELTSRFRSLFDQSIAACLRSSTPVASHLSGGLDSSSVVCRAAELYREGRVASLIRPISARFPGERHDETAWSASVEEHSGLRAMVVGSDPYDWDWAADWCADTYHLPLRPNTMGPLVAVCRRLREEGIGVLLSGEGGDDWLSGSRAHWPDLLRRGRLGGLLAEGLGADSRGGLLRRLGGIALAGAGPWLSPARRRQLFLPHYDCSLAVPEWIRPEWAAKVGLEERWRSYQPPFTLKTFAQQSRHARYVLARHHVNVENGQAYAESLGIEVRHPFHDLRLTTFLMGVPGHLLWRNDERKYLLRRAMLGTLPEKVRTRRCKANFNAPMIEAMARFLSGRRVEELLCVRMGWVKGGSMKESFRAHRAAGEQGLAAATGMPLGAIWSVLSLEVWLRRTMGL